MIMVQPEAEVTVASLPFSADVCLPRLLTISERARVPFLFVHVDRP
jgi:hypothetical protein